MSILKSRAPDIFLRASRDIEQVKRRGQRCSTRLFNLLVAKTDASPTRVGVIVGKRFGNAVRRNRAKRVFRELIRQRHPRLTPGHALLIFPKREALLQPFQALMHHWDSSLQRCRVLEPR